MIVGGRQSGRTTRMLGMAMRVACRGDRVEILTTDEADAVRLRKLLCEDERAGKPDGFTVLASEASSTNQPLRSIKVTPISRWKRSPINGSRRVFADRSDELLAMLLARTPPDELLGQLLGHPVTESVWNARDRKRRAAS